MGPKEHLFAIICCFAENRLKGKSHKVGKCVLSSQTVSCCVFRAGSHPGAVSSQARPSPSRTHMVSEQCPQLHFRTGFLQQLGVKSTSMSNFGSSVAEVSVHKQQKCRDLIFYLEVEAFPQGNLSSGTNSHWKCLLRPSISCCLYQAMACGSNAQDLMLSIPAGLGLYDPASQMAPHGHTNSIKGSWCICIEITK